MSAVTAVYRSEIFLLAPAYSGVAKNSRILLFGRIYKKRAALLTQRNYLRVYPCTATQQELDLNNIVTLTVFTVT